MPNTSGSEAAKVVSLVSAAARAKARYARMLDHVLRGEVEGWQNENGRWVVDERDLERFVRERQSRLAAA